jgi:hypothetical protein
MLAGIQKGDEMFQGKWLAKLLGSAALLFSYQFAGGEAQAATPLTNPWGNDRVLVGAAMDNNQQKVVWLNMTTNACFTDIVGNSAGLDQDYVVVGGNSDDSAFHHYLSSACGIIQDNDLQYNGHYLDYHMGGGRDTLVPATSGAGNTYFFGGANSDYMYMAYQMGDLQGEDGNDDLFGFTGSADVLFGGDGNDCLADSSGVAAVFDCGPGWDAYYNIFHSSCEVPKSNSTDCQNHAS